MGNRLIRLWKDESGIGTLELILIVAVIVIIAVAFRKWIVHWVQKLIGESNAQLNTTGTDSIDINQ